MAAQWAVMRDKSVFDSFHFTSCHSIPLLTQQSAGQCRQHDSDDHDDGDDAGAGTRVLPRAVPRAAAPAGLGLGAVLGLLARRPQDEHQVLLRQIRVRRDGGTEVSCDIFSDTQ